MLSGTPPSPRISDCVNAFERDFWRSGPPDSTVRHVDFARFCVVSCVLVVQPGWSLTQRRLLRQNITYEISGVDCSLSLIRG